MKPTKLRELIEALLPDWVVTINEQYMMNVQADEYERHAGFVYVEEFAPSTIDYRMGRIEKYTHDVYFCVLGEYADTPEQREAVREARIYEAVERVEDFLANKYAVRDFAHDVLPRGFDANEILVHVRFTASERKC